MSWRAKFAAMLSCREGRAFLICALILLLVMAFAGVHLYLQHKLDRMVAAIRARGEPMSWEDLNHYQPPVPDEDNAAPLLEQAFAKMIPPEKIAGVDMELLPILGKAPSPRPGETMPQDIRQAVAVFLAANREALQLLRQASGRKGCRWSVKCRFDNPSSEHRERMHSLFGLLSLQVMSHLEEGEYDSALQVVKNSMRLAKILQGGVFVISYLDCIRLVHRQIEMILNAWEWPIEQVDELVELMMDETSDGLSLQKAFVSQRAIYFDISWRHDVSVEIRGIKGLSNSLLARDPSLDEALDGVFGDLLIVAYFYLGGIMRDQCCWLQYQSEFIAVSHLDYVARLRESKNLRTKARKRSELYPMTRLICGANHFLLIDHALFVAELRCVRTVLAVEQYRLRHGDLPTALAELVPDHLSSVPRDPFDGGELRCRITRGQELKWHKLRVIDALEPPGSKISCTQPCEVPGNGYVVYSIGVDKVDDGGTLCSPDGARRNTDLTFTVNR